MFFEQFPARHGDDTNLLAFRGELLASNARQLQFSTRTHQDAVNRFTGGFTLDDVRTLCDAFFRGTRQVRNNLSGQGQSRRSLVGGTFNGDLVRTHGFVTIGRTHHKHTRHGSVRGQVLNRLVSRSVFPDANGIVGHDVDGAGARQGGDSHRGSGVIGEDKEGRAIGDETRRVQRNTVGDSRHTVFTNAISDIAFRRRVLLEVTKLLHQGHVGRSKIGGTANKARNGTTQSVQGSLGVNSGRDALVFRRERRQRVSPASRQLTGGDGLVLSVVFRVLGSVRGLDLLPFGLQFRTLGAAVHGLLNGFWDFKFTVLPVQVLTRGFGFVLAQRSAVHIVSVGLVR